MTEWVELPVFYTPDLEEFCTISLCNLLLGLGSLARLKHEGLRDDSNSQLMQLRIDGELAVYEGGVISGKLCCKDEKSLSCGKGAWERLTDYKQLRTRQFGTSVTACTGSPQMWRKFCGLENCSSNSPNPSLHHHRKAKEDKSMNGQAEACKHGRLIASIRPVIAG